MVSSEILKPRNIVNGGNCISNIPSENNFKKYVNQNYDEDEINFNQMHEFDDLKLHKHIDDKPLPYDTTEFANQLESNLKTNHINEHQIQIEQLMKYIAKIETKSNRLEIDYQNIQIENSKMKEKLEK